jgi:predicted unusual protein kinase regulating ubiquinone biosynthesis (AarF/ABC1/UbiB family)
MQFPSLAIVVVLALTTTQHYCAEAFTSKSLSGAGGSSMLKLSSRDNEDFQRRLLATRLKQNNRENQRNDDEKTELLEDADGVGIALQEKSETEASAKAESVVLINGTVASADFVEELMANIEIESEKMISEIVEEECEITDTGEPVDPLCADEDEKAGFRARFKNRIGKTMQLVRGVPNENVVSDGDDLEEEEEFDGDLLEEGWFKRGESSALRRNAEVWKFALKCVFRALKPRSMRKKGASEDEVKQAQIDAATFIRDGLLTLGPTFVKLGQVISTRTDVLPKTYTDVLKSLQDEVPAFSGARAKEIVAKELGKPIDEVFTDFSETPLKAASLGQVHTAYYKGQKVAIKVQRAGLKELFDVDLKNLRKLAVLLDKFDPKSDGADRDWVSIYEESERLLYLEIDYLHEADNGERFANDFKDIDYVRVPKFYRDLSTPRVLVMEFIESLKLTDIEKIESLGLDRDVLAKRTADAFLRQIVETSYFHCDPHPGNLCVDDKGNLVYYDFGMMDELKPNVREGFRKFCTALFAGGPMVNDNTLAKNAKQLIDGVEEAGVLARGADRLAVEKLARFFMRAFKNNQIGKSSGNIKQTLGTDLQTLTENDSFRFPSTFTFIFRAFASVEGIGKGLDESFDIGKMAQPFIEKFTDSQKGYETETQKQFNIFQKATGLNTKDIETAVTSPRKIAYIEETLRSMEEGTLKVRVRSLENEKALERMALTQGRTENILLATMLLNLAGFASKRLVAGAGYAGFAFFLFQAFMANTKVKKFDKTQAKFVQTKFNGEDDE